MSKRRERSLRFTRTAKPHQAQSAVVTGFDRKPTLRSLLQIVVPCGERFSVVARYEVSAVSVLVQPKLTFSNGTVPRRRCRGARTNARYRGSAHTDHFRRGGRCHGRFWGR